MMPSIGELAFAVNSKGGRDVYDGFTIGLDPGQTTGYAILNSSVLFKCGQLSTGTIGSHTYKQVEDLFTGLKHIENVRVAIEDYRVYSNKSDSHKLAELHTPKLIGMIIGLCILYERPWHLRMAVEAKSFCMDQNLKKWGVYVEGQRHARDAIRHAVYSYIFDSQEKFK